MKSIILTISQIIFTLLLYIAGIVVIGAALYPAMLFVLWSLSYSHGMWIPFAVAAAFFIFGLSLMLIVGVLRLILMLRLKEGDYKIGSAQMLKWMFVNAMFLCVRTVFMEFMLLTPFCSFFYRLMGAKLGGNVQINSKNVADHSLLEIGDNVVIGGNATVIGHSFEAKGLRLAKVKIGKNVIIGLNSVIMPGVTIGEGSVIAAGAIVPKNTTIEPHTIYYNPDRQVKKA